MALHFGEPRTLAELARPLAKHVELVEVRLEAARAPKRATWASLRKRLGARQFSVVTCDSLLSEDPQPAIDAACAAAVALEARFAVLQAPPSLRPGASSEKRVVHALGLLREGLRDRSTQVLFEPSGLWQKSRVRPLCAEAGVGTVQRLEDVEPAKSLYLRLLQVATGRARLAKRLVAVADAIVRSEEAWVVVVGSGAATLQRSLLEAVEALEDDPEPEEL